MAAKTLSEKVDELTKTAIELAEVVKAIRTELDRLATEMKRLEVKVEPVAVIEREVADLKAHRDEWGRRAWAVFIALGGVLLGSALTYLLKR